MERFTVTVTQRGGGWPRNHPNVDFYFEPKIPYILCGDLGLGDNDCFQLIKEDHAGELRWIHKGTKVILNVEPLERTGYAKLISVGV